MDDKVFQLIIDRIDKAEAALAARVEKVELIAATLLEFKWKVIGLAIAAGVIAGGVFELVIAVIPILQSKGG